MMPKDLSTISKSLFKVFLNSFDMVLCDCNGVIWKWKTAVPGVKESLTKLRQLGKQINFVSNNNTVTMTTLLKDLNSCGFAVKLEEIVNPNLAIIDYLNAIRFDQKIFIIGTELMKKEFSGAGFGIEDSGPDRIENSITELGKHIRDNKDVGAVICDIELNVNFIKLHKALVYLQRSDVHFIVGGSDKTLAVGLPTLLIGPGYFQNPVESISGRIPIRFGKPASRFNEFIVKKFNIKDPSRILFIGDSLKEDMAFAGNHGYQKLLVLTGVTNLEQAVKHSSNTSLLPNYYIKSLGDLRSIIEANFDC